MVSFETVHKHPYSKINFIYKTIYILNLLHLLHKWSHLKQFINIRKVNLTLTKHAISRLPVPVKFYRSETVFT
mgnify:FL=1